MKKNKYSMIHEDEKKCIWMTAGLIAYKLCLHDYQCENCIFDKVIRNDSAFAEGLHSERSAAAADSVSHGPAATRVHGDLFYHYQHCWARVEKPDVVRIGLDGLMAEMITGIKTVALPCIGEAILQGQCFAHIILDKYILPIISPLAGSICSVNDNLQKTPRQLALDCWNSGWLITIKPDSLEHDLREMIYGKRAIEWYNKKKRDFEESVNAFLFRDRGDLGATMQDGGERIASLVDALSTEQYYHVLELLSRAEDAI